MSSKIHRQFSTSSLNAPLPPPFQTPLTQLHTANLSSIQIINVQPTIFTAHVQRVGSALLLQARILLINRRHYSSIYDLYLSLVVVVRHPVVHIKQSLTNDARAQLITRLLYVVITDLVMQIK